jgi:hypothetical protein
MSSISRPRSVLLGPGRFGRMRTSPGRPERGVVAPSAVAECVDCGLLVGAQVHGCGIDDQSGVVLVAVGVGGGVDGVFGGVAVSKFLAHLHADVDDVVAAAVGDALIVVEL